MSIESVLSPGGDWSRTLLRALDRPARHALDLARRPWLHTVAPAVVGLFLVAASTTVAAWLDPSSRGLSPRADVLRALCESLAVVVPGLAVLATYARLRITPGALVAGAALGLLVAGVVSLSLVPLMAFLALVSRDVVFVLRGLALLVPAVALASVAVVVLRVLDAVDRSARAQWLGRGFVVGLFVVFGLRTADFMRQFLAAM